LLASLAVRAKALTYQTLGMTTFIYLLAHQALTANVG